jgi:anti-anti-sigma factor
MHINADNKSDHTVLHLRGEFDTYYCRSLLEAIDAQVAAGVVHVVLNLRLVKFINSTALGAIIKASKVLAARGGRLAIARPSPFCRDIMEKVGLNRVVPSFDTEEAAAAGLRGEAAPSAGAAAKGKVEDESAVLFSPADAERIEHFLSASKRFKDAIVNPIHGHAFGTNWNGVGRMASLDEHGLHFYWNGGDTGLDPFAMGQLLAIGTQWKVKFRVPLFQPGYLDAVATITDVEERADGVKIGASFAKIDEKTLKAVRQYAIDLRFLKDELKRSTGA